MRPLVVLSLFDASGIWASAAPEGSTIYTVDMSGTSADRVVNGRRMFHMPCDVRLMDIPHDRVDVLLAAPPCEALGVMHAGHAQRGTATMSRAEGLALVETTLALVRRFRPRVWCVENPAKSALWTLLPRRQVVAWGWYGYPGEKRTGLGGEFTPLPALFPVPIIDPTEGGRRPCALKKGVGGVQALPRGRRALTPYPFAVAWWKAQEERLASF